MYPPPPPPFPVAAPPAPRPWWQRRGVHIASFLVFPFASFLIAWTWASRPLWKKLLSSAIAAFCCLAWIGAATSPQPAPQPPAPAVPPAATVTVTATPTPTETQIGRAHV